MRGGNVTVPAAYIALMARLSDDAFVSALADLGVRQIEHLHRDAAYYTAMVECREYRETHPYIEEDNAMHSSMIIMSKRKRQPRRYKLATSFSWGQVSFTSKPSKTPGSRSYVVFHLTDEYVVTHKKQNSNKTNKRHMVAHSNNKRSYLQCTCPRRSHSSETKGGTTYCTWTLPFRSEAEKDLAVRRMKHWASQCFMYRSRRAHQHYKPDEAELPQDPESGRIPTDRELTDDEERIARRRQPKAKSKGRGGGTFGGPRGRGGRGAQRATSSGSEGSSSGASSSSGSSSSGGRPEKQRRNQETSSDRQSGEVEVEGSEQLDSSSERESSENSSNASVT